MKKKSMSKIIRKESLKKRLRKTVLKADLMADILNFTSGISLSIWNSLRSKASN